MKKNFVSVAALLSLFGALSANAAEWVIDGGHSQAGFKIKHIFTRMPGSFKKFEGTFTYDEKKIADSKGTFTIDAASIETNDAKRDEHLRSPEFFDVQKFPTLTFVTKSASAKGKNKFKLNGDLTIHGVTKPVSFDVEYLGGGSDPWGNEKASFAAVSKINRKDFGMTWNKSLDKGGLLIGEEVEIQIEIEANKKK